ncbi:BTAD domain-containing putative transcriptional regulator [Demequina subtropica]|uniref:BTAD domain-containing putative transcriptional regulator n=1 Tax=Demequina subtropica TaxID=1638989 RepID=UPI00078674B6|nr:BTAD domain-containing putative transcriptional regulator [Demequina subtropica]
MVETRSTPEAQDGAAVAVRAFGEVAIVRGGVPTPVPGAGRRALLALLASHVGRPVPVDAITEAMWPGGPPRSSAKVIQTYVSQLRPLLGDGVLRTVPAGYVLDLPRAHVDVGLFEDAAAACLAACPATLEQLEAASALRVGAPYPDVALPFAEAEAARLDGLHQAVRVARLERQVAEGAAAAAVPELEERASREPSDERVGAILMEALAAVGRRGDALRAHERLRAALADELGVEPDPSIERRYLELLRAHEDGRVADPTPVRAAAPRRAGTAGAAWLPAERGTLIGREDELGRVSDLLATERCVTIVGAGGSGKTRLALRVAHLASSAREVRWVSLAGLADGSRVVQHTMRAVGLPEQIARTPLPVLLERLAPTDTLLVLDNCEHVADGVARLIDALLGACPGVAVLTTSRTPLHAVGEQRWRIPTLGVPTADTPDAVMACASGRLFVERARRADPDLELTAAAAVHVAAICRRLDGVPLALELAAARIGGIALAELDERLGASLVLLTSGGAAVPRHRTLRAAIAWSHELLTDAQRSLLARLSVFAAPFSADAVVTVCAEPGTEAASLIATLGDLVDASVVERSSGGRFRLLETVRQFAAERLGDDAPGVEKRHGEWVAASMSEVGARLMFETTRWYRRLDDLILDAELAFDRALARGDWACAARIGTGAGWSLINTGRYGVQSEWGERLASSGALEALEPAAAGPALQLSGAIANIDGRHDVALSRLAAAARAYAETEDAAGRLWVDYWRASALADQGLYAESHELGREACARAGGHPEAEAGLLAGLAEALAAAHVDASAGPRAWLDEAAEADARARDLCVRHGFEEMHARVDMTDALLLAHRGDPEAALARCVGELERWRGLGRGNRLAVALIAGSRVAWEARRPERARELVSEGLEMLDEAGWALPLGDAVEVAAGVVEDPAERARLLGASSVCMRTFRWHVACDVTSARREAEDALGREGFTRLAGEGAALSFDRVIAGARAATG